LLRESLARGKEAKRLKRGKERKEKAGKFI
jgi:hypothetical protein